MKKIIFTVLLCLSLAACGDSPKQLFDTAELEMLQNNIPHAEQLYREIVEKHPASEYATHARQRLTEIQEKKQAQ